MRRAAVALLVVAALASSADAQFQQRRGGGRFGRGMGAITNPNYDGAFMFCRIMFRNASNGDGGGWSVDWPRADENLSFRLSELTRTSVSQSPTGDWNHVVIALTDTARLSQCPFIMMTEPGGTYFDEAEAAGLRTYLQKGGFLWADDFWGDYAFEHWMNELRKALPSARVPADRRAARASALSRALRREGDPADPVHQFLVRHAAAARQSAAQDSATPHVRAISDRDGRILVVMTHNTDFGDAFEREGDSREYFETFAGAGYAFGVNTLLYAMTH